MKLHRAVWVSNVAILSGLLLLWSWVAQSFSSAQRLALDTLVFVGAFLFVIFGLRLQRRPGGRWAPAVLAAVVAWLALSALEPLMNRPLPRDPDRFSRALRVAAERDLAAGGKWPAKSVGVALSGGGYRAAAYHAGVLDTLDRLGVPVTNVSTVSGGSIIGAFYTLGGETLVFRDALAEGSFNLRRQLALAQNLLRLPLSGFDRGTAQADLLRRRLVFGDAKRARSTCSDCPRLLVGATDLNFGLPVGFLDQGGLLLAYEKVGWSQHHADIASLEGLDLSTLVSISGAFPGAFPGRRIEIETRQVMSNYGSTETIRRTLILGDGGISDNTGLLLLRAAQEQSNRPSATLAGWKVDFIVVSDGGALDDAAIFGLGGNPGTLASLQRAVDVLSARGSEAFQRREMEKRDLVWLSPQPNLPAPMLFDSPDYELSLTTLSPPRRTTQYSPFSYPDAVLAALGGILLGEQESATKAVTAFIEKRKALRPYNENRAIPDLPAARTREQCAQGAPEGQKPATNPDLRALACDAISLGEAFRNEIDRLSLVFRDTPTLRDQLGVEVTRDLFALGQAQALLSWPQLDRHLNRAAIGPPPTIASDPCRQSGPSVFQPPGERMPGASAPAPIPKG